MGISRDVHLISIILGISLILFLGNSFYIPDWNQNTDISTAIDNLNNNTNVFFENIVIIVYVIALIFFLSFTATLLEKFS